MESVDTSERLPILREALADTPEGLDQDESDALLMGVLLLTSPTSLIYWQDYLGLAVAQAAETASWLIRRLTDRW